MVLYEIWEVIAILIRPNHIEPKLYYLANNIV